MVRWRCHRRECRRDRQKRKSTRNKIPPICKCGHPMRIDHYRTSGIESRKQNCYCGILHFQPHRAGSCKAKERRDYAESFNYDDVSI